MTALLCAALSIALAVPSMPRPRHAARVEKASRIRTAKGSALGRARARLAQVKRDPLLRRYRCHWERAIGALEKAARGRDRSQALIEAARARYALYRFSQVESDRDAALRLAVKARVAGARDAKAFAEAIRKEMGEDEPRAKTQTPSKVSPAKPAPPPPPPRRSDERNDE